MPDGPTAALIVFALAVCAGLLYLYVEHRSHHAPHDRTRRPDASRIPLFSTDQLGARAAESREADGPGAGSRIDDERDDGEGVEASAAESPDARPGAPRGPERERARGARQGATPRRPLTVRADAAPPGNGVAPRPGHLADAAAGGDAPSYAPLPVRSATEPGLGAHAATPPRPGAAVGHDDDAPADRPAGVVAPRPPAAPPRRTPPAGFGDPSVHEGATIRFAIPGDHTLQFLPGRLEVVAGPDAGREVRFVRTSGEPLPEITFGRSEGPPYRHVQLLARTVSRQHARMSLLDEHWQLTNLSSTNPVVLNGRPLAQDEVAPLLVDGDRIEMGEVGFSFHSR